MASDCPPRGARGAAVSRVSGATETLVWFALRSHTRRNARRKPKRKPNCQGRPHVYLKDGVAAQTIAQTNRSRGPDFRHRLY